MTTKIRYYQQEAIFSLFDYFSENKVGNPIIALPTGTGKSHVIAGFIELVMQHWPTQKFIVATHVKEIIAHNANKLLEAWPTAPLGIHSASLKRRDVIHPIVYGGIASMIKDPLAFGHRDLLIIDECHLLSPNANTMYQRFIAQLKTINPWLRVIGLSATPYRLAHGSLTDGGLFTDICYDLTNLDAFNRLVSEGYLAPLVPKRTKLQLDISNVGISAGDFKQNELEAAVNTTDVTEQALDEILAYGEDRGSWLIFASGINHAEEIVAALLARGVTAAAVHFRCTADERDERIKAFKSGAIQAIVNNNVLTTGFDHPPIDLIGMLRPTVSPGLWVQMLGRGTRPSKETGKENCLVLDFAGNTLRLGPINDPVLPRKKGSGKGTPGRAPAKACPACDTLMHPSATVCPSCGHEFEFDIGINSTASQMPLMASSDVMPTVEWYTVDYVTYNQHNKYGSPPMVKVVYYCGLNIFREFLMFEHEKMSFKARRWWREREPWGEPPSSTAEALERIGSLRKPLAIRVWINKKYPEILTYSFDGVTTNG
jgi:DNA repair protein RadD